MIFLCTESNRAWCDQISDKPTNARELIGILEEIEKNIQKPRSEEKQEKKVTNLFVQKAMELHFYEIIHKS